MCYRGEPWVQQFSGPMTVIGFGWHDPRSRPPAEGANPAASGAASTPHNPRGTLQGHSNGTDAPTQPRTASGRNENVPTSATPCTLPKEPPQTAVGSPGHPEGTRKGAARSAGNSPPPTGWGGPRIEAPPLMTAPPRGGAGRDGALLGQHTPANLWEGPRTEAHPLMTTHEASRYGACASKPPRPSTSYDS